MKKIMIASAALMAITLHSAGQYSTNWMHQVKSWDVQINFSYRDSANPGNYTRIQFIAKGIITNEVMPAGSRMAWPQIASPDGNLMKTLLAKGNFEKRVTEDMPEPNRVEEYSCSGNINEKIMASIGATFSDLYAVNIRMPLIPQVSCTGKGAPQDSQTLQDMVRNVSIEPTDANVLVGNTGSTSHALTGRKTYETENGARVIISWIYTPLAVN